MTALWLGATTKQIQHDYRCGFIKYPSNEPGLPGHIYNAGGVAADQGMNHILNDAPRFTSPTARADCLLAREFASPALERAIYVFHGHLSSATSPSTKVMT